MISDESLIAPAVIVPFKFQILCSSGYGSRQAESYLNNFGSTVSKAYQVGTGDGAIQQFGYFKFQIVLRSKGESPARLPLYRFDDLRMRMADESKVPTPAHNPNSRFRPRRKRAIRRHIRKTEGTAGGPAHAARNATRQGTAGTLVPVQGSRGLFPDTLFVKFRLERSVRVAVASFRLDKMNS